ncbi:hypothetical protein AJ78_06911 [Emergomyces pasteurianus Ep9510]|uniref:DUF7918 domain-containing protein n=1 Tax=Emergomyces pasteurianus Ep9510 TaxID=1447872 RepID=A0A1J9QBH0_9EURO|nr:hypothetical protein AJ78_06911 [Emergomyces pasteurianus Ep9510]
MPCFKGLAVSIHTPNGPLPEYSVQRQSRASRIACYIPVPPPKVPDPATGKSEQSTFAISITLLTPGQNVPYSTPKPTPENPHPKAKVVGISAKSTNTIGPYQPLTTSPNETVAAYIYFDGRQKEEVATLLRRGEETWVNSRWVSIPESQGGGLAEREFLFREVGLERWLNGLDLEGKGKDTVAKIERRKQKMERRRRKRELNQQLQGKMGQDGSDAAMMMMETDERKTRSGQSVLRYGDDAKSPVENLSDVEYSAESEEDDDPIPETAGQIKVALFRVLASGEIKRGEYSPQFDAQDDDEDNQGQGPNGKGDDDRDVDHTTSFAKPKTLDPKSISTQTVTGIDGPDRPYAIFTFMYRGERQLQRMGILDTKSRDKDNKASVTRRISLQPDLASLAPLNRGGTAGFVKFRDNNNNESGLGKSRKKPRRGSGSDMDDSDYDDDDNGSASILHKAEEEEDKDVISSLLSPDDIRQQGELAEGVRQIKLKRQHSAEPITQSGNVTSKTSKSNTPASVSTPPAATTTTTTATTSANATTATGATTPPHHGIAGGSSSLEPPEPHMNTNSHSSSVLETEPAFIGSPMKKQRASVLGADDDVFNMKRLAGSGLATNIQEIMGSAPAPGSLSSGSGGGGDISVGATASAGTGLGSGMIPRSNLNIEQKPPQVGHIDLDEDL